MAAVAICRAHRIARITSRRMRSNFESTTTLDALSTLRIETSQLTGALSLLKSAPDTIDVRLATIVIKGLIDLYEDDVEGYSRAIPFVGDIVDCKESVHPTVYKLALVFYHMT